MSAKSTTIAATNAAEKLRKAKAGVKAHSAAVSEAARIRQMFADDRKRLEKRYGIISVTGSSVD